jgi:anti-anti-sigma regulatory factor
LLYLTFVQHVTVEELERALEDMRMLLADLTSGFRLVSDLSRLDSIDVNCAAVIGKQMELCDQKGLGLVIRVIPDPTKDIGLNILSHFHYHHHPQVITCNNMTEAARLLSL